MKRIVNEMYYTISVKKDELLEGKWLPLSALSKKLKDLEESERLTGKCLRQKMYNTRESKGFNLKELASITCIDTESPMLRKSSINLTFSLAQKEEA